MKRLNNRLGIRLLVYLLGLFIMTIGIAISVKSDLGVSPISSVPYTLTCVWGIEMGKATILFHTVLVLLQLLMLRKKFPVKNFLQIVVGIVFGYFTTFCNSLMEYVPSTENLVIRVLLSLVSAFLVAFGVFLYMPTGIMPLAGEGTAQALSQLTHIEFSKCKIIFDSTMVVISLITCLIAIHSMGSVGAGTIISAVLVGTIVGWLNKGLGKWRDRILYGDPQQKRDMSPED